MLKHRTIAAALLASASVAAWATTSGGQDVPARAVEPRAVIAAPAPPPAAPGTPAVAPFPDGFPGHGADVLFHVQHPVMEALDDETRELHERDRAHEASTRQLIQQYRDAESGGARSDLQEKLATVVRDHFETRQQLREKELAALEARVRRLRELHEKREDAKDEIVEQRVEQLLRDAEGLGWSSGGDGPQAINLSSPTFVPGLQPHNWEKRIELRTPRRVER